jgi:hypothetical protein
MRKFLFVPGAFLEMSCFQVALIKRWSCELTCLEVCLFKEGCLKVWHVKFAVDEFAVGKIGSAEHTILERAVVEFYPFEN